MNESIREAKISRWKNRLKKSGSTLDNVKVLADISRGEEFLFGTILDCKLTTPEGKSIPRCVVVFGDSVIVVPVLHCVDDGQIYTLMVEQRRVVTGGFIKEFPSGGIDFDCENAKQAACREVSEEVNMKISVNDLKPLSSEPIKANPSFLGDEAYFFYFEKEISKSFLQDFVNTGCHDDGEDITIRVVKMGNVCDELSLSALIGIKLLEKTIRKAF